VKCIQYSINEEVQFGMNFIVALFGLIFLAAGAFIIKKAKDEENTLYRISRAPPIELEDAADGVPVKSYGKIICDETFKAPYSGKPCVWSHSITEEYRETRDSKGRKSGSWHTVEDKTNSAPFLLEDKTGRIGVNLKDASGEFIDGNHVYDWNGYEMGHQRRKNEWIISNENAFVYGLGIKEGNTVVVMKSSREPIAVSFRTEEEFLKIKRSDDKMVNVAGYGMLLIGACIMAWAIMG
jgi:hypothetical protein